MTDQPSGGVIRAQQLRVLGDHVDGPECYLPLHPGHRGVGILDATLRAFTQSPLTPEQRARQAAEHERAEAARVKALTTLTDRHTALLDTVTHPTLRTLLAEHAPQMDVGTGRTHCLGCPSYVDESEFSVGDVVHHDWPCPTWSTVDTTTTT